jgi:molecular chaperone DnaK (HSP70)
MTTIGIDLGTSNSAAVVLRGGRPVITFGPTAVEQSSPFPIT